MHTGARHSCSQKNAPANIKIDALQRFHARKGFRYFFRLMNTSDWELCFEGLTCKALCLPLDFRE